MLRCFPRQTAEDEHPDVTLSFLAEPSLANGADSAGCYVYYNSAQVGYTSSYRKLFQLLEWQLTWCADEVAKFFLLHAGAVSKDGVGIVLPGASKSGKSCLMVALVREGYQYFSDEIAAIDGVDCLWIGHFDLSASLGIPGQFDSDRFNRAVDAVVAAAAKHDKSIGRLVGSPEEGARLFRQGFDFICYLGDAWLLQRALSEGFSAIRSQFRDDVLAGENQQ